MESTLLPGSVIVYYLIVPWPVQTTSLVVGGSVPALLNSCLVHMLLIPEGQRPEES